MTIYNTNIDIGELFIFSITYMKGETIMNINTVKNQSSSAYQMLYANKNANKKISLPLKLYLIDLIDRVFMEKDISQSRHVFIMK